MFDGLIRRELKVRLFLRTKRKVELTQAGALFLPPALETLRQAELALRANGTAQ